MYFLGWYLGEDLFDFQEELITSNITLKAKMGRSLTRYYYIKSLGFCC